MKISQRLFLVLIVLIHALYFVGSIFLKTYMNNDSVEYLAQAKNIAEHASFYASNWDVWPHNPAFYTLRPPLYGILVLLTVYSTSSAYVLLFVQSVMSVFIWWKLARVCRQYLPGIHETLLYLFLIGSLLLNPVQLVLCNSIFSDVFFQFILTLAFFQLLDFVQFRQLKHFWFYVVFTALALFTKPALVYFSYVNIALCIWMYFKIRRHRAVLLGALVLPFIIIMVSNINQRVTGYYHYSASKVENLWTYNTTNFLNMKYGHDSGYAYKVAIWQESKKQEGYAAQYGFVDSACTHVLKENLQSYITYHAQGVLNFFIAPGREFINGYLKKNEAAPKSFIKEVNVNGWQGAWDYFQSQPIFLLLLNVLVTLWNVFLLLGLIGFVLLRRIPLYIKIITILLIFYIAGVSSLAIGTARYKIAIYPILLFCNACYFRLSTNPLILRFKNRLLPPFGAF